MPAQHDATDSYLGYLFQGQYALLALWDTAEDDAVVSVETEDDVVVEGRELRLTQLKHSTGTPADLTVSNVGFWKTIRIWAAHSTEARQVETTHVTSDPAAMYLFVTVADIATADGLEPLTAGGPRTESVIQAAEGVLAAEATRVRNERTEARAAGTALPHADRAAGCEAFLELTPAQRLHLVTRLVIVPRSFRITDIQGEVERRLQEGASVRAAVRRSVAQRIIERWDRQVALSLMKKRSRDLHRSELLSMVEGLIREHGPTMLPNDYGELSPPLAEYTGAEGSVLERQIVLVDGGSQRVTRAVRDRWRARNQRRRWTDDDASLVTELKAYDDVLKEAWSDQHGPMCDDCRALDDAEQRRRGLGILEWAYVGAPISVRPPRSQWTDGFYVRGMLQQFADDLEVGWHPEYLSKLGAAATGVAASESNIGTTTAPATAELAGASEPPALVPQGASVALQDQLPSERALVAGDSVSAGVSVVRRARRPRRARSTSAEPSSIE